MREMVAYKNDCVMDIQACTEPGTLSYKALLIRYINRGATRIDYAGRTVYEAPITDAMRRRAEFVSEVVRLYKGGLHRTAIAQQLKRSFAVVTRALREGGVNV